MFNPTLLAQPTSTPSEIGHGIIHTAIFAGAGAVWGAVIGTASGGVVKVHVTAFAVIGGLYCLLTYVPARIMANSTQLSTSTKLIIGGIYESCIVSASILALRHFGAIGNFGTLFLGSVCLSIFFQGIRAESPMFY